MILEMGALEKYGVSSCRICPILRVDKVLSLQAAVRER